MINPRRSLRIAFAIVAVGSAGFSAGEAPKGPRLACDEPTFDFGARDNSSELGHSFVLRNDGDAPLQIDRVRTGCGCTQADVSEKVVPPGGTATVRVRVNLRNRWGAQRISVFVHSNDPEHSFFQLQCVGSAVSEVEITPRTILFRMGPEEEMAEQSVSLVSRSATPLNITAVQSMGAFISVKLETNELGKAYRLTVQVRTNQAAQGQIQVLTDHPVYGVLTLPVSVQFLPEIEVEPHDVLLLDRGAGAPPETRYIFVRSTKQKPFKILAIEPAVSGVKASVVASGPNWYRLRIANLVPTPDMSNAAIRVRTDLKGAETVQIPFRLVRISGGTNAPVGTAAPFPRP